MIRSKAYMAVILLMIIGFMTYACGGGGGSGGSSSGGSGSVTISASVGAGYTVAQAPGLFDKLVALLTAKPAIALFADVVDQVVAVPSTQGHFGGDMLNIMQTATIASDGSFSLSLDRSYEWVLLLANSQATSLSERVVSYVSVRITDEDTLVAYSGGRLQADMELGELTRSGNEARGAYDEAAFNLTLDQIKRVAQSDDGYKHLINAYLNYNPSTGTFYSAQPIFNWDAGSYLGLDGSSGPDALAAMVLDGFTVYVETNNITQPSVDDVCAGAASFGLFPPSAVMDGNLNIYDADNGMLNDADHFDTNIGPSGDWFDEGKGSYYCYDSDFGAQYFSGGNSVLYNFKGARSVLRVPVDGMPKGQWLLKSGDTTLAEFDLAVGSPLGAFDTFTVPLPVLQVNRGSDGAITTISASWFVYDQTAAAYQPLDANQMAAVKSLVRDSFITVQDEDGTLITPGTVKIDQEIIYSDGGLVTSLDLTKDSKSWYFPGSAGDTLNNLVPTYIAIGYHLGGLEYQFVWNHLLPVD